MSFGMMEAMLSFLRRQVGLRTDAADAAGSLHAKLKEARDTIDNKIGASTNGRADNTLFGFASTQVKSIQRGLTNTGGASKNVTISAVNTSNAFVIANGRRDSAGSSGSGITASLTSSTNLELKSGFFDENGVRTSAEISWEVVEFY